MNKKTSNPNPPKGSKKPLPPPPPPSRIFRETFKETKESIRKGEDYDVYMRGYRHGFETGKHCEK